jgi:hypothetical protein
MINGEIYDWFNDHYEELDKQSWKADKLADAGYGQTVSNGSWDAWPNGPYPLERSYLDGDKRHDGELRHFVHWYMWTSIADRSFKNADYREHFRTSRPEYWKIRCPQTIVLIAQAAGVDPSVVQAGYDEVRRFEDDHPGLRGSAKKASYMRNKIDGVSPLSRVFKTLHMEDVSMIVRSASSWDEVKDRVADLNAVIAADHS